MEGAWILMATVTLSSAYPKGQTARAFVRATDTFSPGQAVVAQATVGDDGRVRLSSQKLKVGAQYFVQVGDSPSAVSVQAKDESFNEDANLHRDGPEATVRRLQADRQAQADARADAEKTNPLAASPAPGRNVTDNRPKKRSPSVAEPQPGPKQQEISGPQRSDTPDGEAFPKDPGEHVPQVPQEQVSANTPQRSSTETGVATVKDSGETVPAAKQEDVPNSRPQRSATETGTAEPKPVVKGADVAKRRDASSTEARGRTAVKAEENVKPKATPKNTTKTGTPKRSSRKR